jgi:23S rRNA (guanosine2251-2'-O)-methyltransferase
MRHKNERIWLYGLHACRAALQNKNRLLFEVCLLNDKLGEQLSSLDLIPPSKMRSVDKTWFEKKFGVGAVHQGIAIQVSPLLAYCFEDLEKIKDPNQLVIVLDQINDPHNVGAIIRSAAAFGTKAIIMTDRHSPDESSVLAKSASGALELIPLIRCSNLAQALEKLKRTGFWTYGFAESGKTSLQKTDFSGKVALIFGTEGKGLRRLTSENCDFLVRLETSQTFSTLNVSNAAAIALHTVFSYHQGERT